MQEVAACEDHWKQEFNVKEICDGWSNKEPRKPASESAEGGESAHDETDFSASRRRRGVGARSRLGSGAYRNSYFGESNPSLDTNSLFGGSAVGTYPQQRTSRKANRDGLPRNSRREVIACPGLEGSVNGCLSAIIAAESSCSTSVRHKGRGIGLCAIENDSRRHRFGSDCANVSSLSGQIACCKAIYAKVGMKYFGGRTRRIAAAACGR